MKQYATFIKADKGLHPISLCNDDVTAIGKLITKMDEMFSDLNTEDEEMSISYRSRDYVNEDGHLMDGFQISATCYYGNPSEKYSHLVDLTGYALAMETEE